MKKRFAAIDIGTNTTLLAVADFENGSLAPVLERASITRLGRDLSRTGVIGEQGLAETLAALRGYLGDCRRLSVDRLEAVGTAAMRSAANRSAVLAAFLREGVNVDVIPGEKEAALTFLSSLHDFGRRGCGLAVIDVGGGSTEVILGNEAGISWRKSFPIGVVKLKESVMPSDPPTDSEREAARRAVEAGLSGIPPGQGMLAVAVAGTPTTLAAIKNGVPIEAYSRDAVHGTVLDVADLLRLDTMIAPMSLTERRIITGLEPKRADVIDAGILILRETMRRLGADSITVSDGGVRWGVLWEMVSETGSS